MAVERKEIIRLVVCVALIVFIFIYSGWRIGLVFSFLLVYTEADRIRHERIDKQIDLIAKTLELIHKDANAQQ